MNPANTGRGGRFRACFKNKRAFGGGGAARTCGPVIAARAHVQTSQRVDPTCVLSYCAW
ncbi:hypothetical protein SBV1_680005 [Verrucomicrobia bacterium]|nr:hypothetical protein SBV1_680005 [Verrucomicrobiota bacterium]